MKKTTVAFICATALMGSAYADGTFNVVVSDNTGNDLHFNAQGQFQTVPENNTLVQHPTANQNTFVVQANIDSQLVTTGIAEIMMPDSTPANPQTCLLKMQVERYINRGGITYLKNASVISEPFNSGYTCIQDSNNSFSIQPN